MKYVKPLDLFNVVKKYNENLEFSDRQCDRQCLFGVDTGEVCTGLAKTNLILTNSKEFKVINMYKYQGSHELANYLLEEIEKRKIGGLVVGYSAMMHNHRLEEEHRARVFKWLKTAHESDRLISFPFTFVDERYSSKKAKKVLNGRVPPPRDYNRQINQVAASVFTKCWLNKINTRKFDENSRLEKHLESVGDDWNKNHGNKNHVQDKF